MGDITIYNTDCKTEKDNVHVPGTQELEHKKLGSARNWVHFSAYPPKPSLSGKSTNHTDS
jgi:hypothetical protein